MKTGCGIETLQFTTEAALQPAIALLSVVAVFLLGLRDAGRDPETAARAGDAVRAGDATWRCSAPGGTARSRTGWTVREFYWRWVGWGGIRTARDGRPGLAGAVSRLGHPARDAGRGGGHGAASATRRRETRRGYVMYAVRLSYGIFRVQVRGISRQGLQPDPTPRARHELLDLHPPMDRRAVPDHQQPIPGHAEQVQEELDAVQAVERFLPDQGVDAALRASSPP